MTLVILLVDELRHYLRSRLVLIVLASLPFLTAAGSLAQSGEDAHTLVFAAFMGASLAGMVCGAMVCTTLVAELQLGTPVLFAIRPLPRLHLLLARFLAMVATLCAAMAVALSVGAALSAWLHPEAAGVVSIFRAGLLLSFACAVLSGSFGVLVGVTVSSMLGAVLLFLLVAMQLSNAVIFVYEGLCRWTSCTAGLRDAYILAGAVLIASALMAISGRIFSRRPL